jgi:hypothetical protein
MEEYFIIANHAQNNMALNAPIVQRQVDKQESNRND